MIVPVLHLRWNWYVSVGRGVGPATGSLDLVAESAVATYWDNSVESRDKMES